MENKIIGYDLELKENNLEKKVMKSEDKDKIINDLIDFMKEKEMTYANLEQIVQSIKQHMEYNATLK